MAVPRYQRILLKISGEALMGSQSFGLSPEKLAEVSNDVKTVIASGVQICIVVGGGNIFRGVAGEKIGIEPATADYMGMLATVMNALALQSALEKIGVATRVQSAIKMETVAEPYIRRRALRHMEKGRVVIFAAGTGNPYFTTDTAATLRASEMMCDALFKATKVDGIYDSDPAKNLLAKRYDRLSYQDVLTQRLNVMDATAIALARENKMPIIVFSMEKPGAISDIVTNKGVCTIVHDDE
ncbi:MAG: pyrH [Alphaproteobacteria bacterium]|nr:pyrH [Alphaproteobacteria bacterium]